MSDSQMCRDDHGHLGYMVQCSECKGWGRFDMGGYLIECEECGGTGEVWIGEEDFYQPDYDFTEDDDETSDTV